MTVVIYNKLNTDQIHSNILSTLEYIYTKDTTVYIVNISSFKYPFLRIFTSLHKLLFA